MFLEERSRCEQLEQQNVMMQETLQQAQKMKEMIVEQFEKELEHERFKTQEAEAALGRLAKQLEHERSKRRKAEAASGRAYKQAVDKAGRGPKSPKGRNGRLADGPSFDLPKEDSEALSEIPEEATQEATQEATEEALSEGENSWEESDEEINTFRAYKTPGGIVAFLV